MKRPPTPRGEEIPLGGRPAAAQMCTDSAGNSPVSQESRLIWGSVVLTQLRLGVLFPEGPPLTRKNKSHRSKSQVWIRGRECNKLNLYCLILTETLIWHTEMPGVPVAKLCEDPQRLIFTTVCLKVYDCRR